MSNRARELPVVVATVLRPVGGTGVQTHFRELVRYLEGSRASVALVTPFSAGGVARDAVFAFRRLLEPVSKSASVWWYRAFHRRFLERALRRRLRHLGDAVIYCQCPLSALAAVRARAHAGQRVVLAVHFCRSQADEWVRKRVIREGGAAYRAIRREEQAAMAVVEGLVYVSETARAELWLSPPDVPSVVSPNFVSAASPVEGPAAHATDLVTVGALEAHKNHAFILDVVAAMHRRGHRVTLDVIGEGPGRRALLTRCRQLGLEEHVRLLGYVADPRRLLPGHRVYVHAAQQESFGLAVVEAMAAGLPVVAAAVGGVRDLFAEGVEGRFWGLDDPEAAADVLMGVLVDEQARAEMGDRARRRFLGHYDATVTCPDLHRFLVGFGAPPPEGSLPALGSRSAERAAGRAPLDGRTAKPPTATTRAAGGRA